MATDTGTAVGRKSHSAVSTGDRLPVAPRQRRPALAALALLLILGGGLISAVLVLRSGDKQAVIVMRQTVAEGHVITLDDLVSAQVSTGGVPSVPWRQRSQVVGGTAAAELTRGTMLNPRAFSNSPLPGPSQGGVAFALKPDQLPDGIQAGDHVRVFYAPPPTEAASTPPKWIVELEAKSAGVAVRDATVLGNPKQRNDGTVTLTLVVSDTEAWRLSQLSRLNSVALVKLPVGG